jgi:hypothetical protein
LPKNFRARRTYYKSSSGIAMQKKEKALNMTAVKMGSSTKEGKDGSWF